MTVNAGLRFDAITGTISENQLSPRINIVWEPTPEITLRAGYARYFVPAPLNQVSVTALAARAGTVAAPEVMTNDPVRAERSDNIDVGLTVKPVDGLTIGFSGFYKWAENYLDKGQFGAPIFQTAFNYSNAQVRGFELFANYDKGPWSLYANLAWSQVNSHQHHLGPVQLRAGRTRPTSPATGSSPITTRAGRARRARPTCSIMEADWATRVSADLLYGNGLRQTIVTPNDAALPGLCHAQPVGDATRADQRQQGHQTCASTPSTSRTASTSCATGTGVGVGAPQFGMRRAFFVTLSQKF